MLQSFKVNPFIITESLLEKGGQGVLEPVTRLIFKKKKKKRFSEPVTLLTSKSLPFETSQCIPRGLGPSEPWPSLCHWSSSLHSQRSSQWCAARSNKVFVWRDPPPMHVGRTGANRGQLGAPGPSRQCLESHTTVVSSLAALVPRIKMLDSSPQEPLKWRVYSLLKLRMMNSRAYRKSKGVSKGRDRREACGKLGSVS